MQYVNLGRTGLAVSRLALGCMSFGDPGAGRHQWVIPEDESRSIVRAALEAGINFFDTANEYAAGTSERIIGKLLGEMARRDEIVLATKAFAPWRDAPNTGRLSRKALFHAVDDSLARLKSDYIDLYQIHRWDAQTPIEETMEALHDIVKSGKVRYIGASSMMAWQFQKAQFVAERKRWTRFVSMQPQVNLVYREEEREMIPLCQDQGVAILPWSPLARGMLARAWDEKTKRADTDLFGKFLYGSTVENDRQIVEAVGDVARDKELPRAQVAMAWLLAKPGITAPIVGVTRAEQLVDALASLEVALTDEEIGRLESPYRPHAVAGMAPPMPIGGTVSVAE